MWLVTVYLLLGAPWLILKKVCPNTWYFKFVDYLFKFVQNTMFMRLFILSYSFMWLACMDEIGIVDNPKDHASSYSFAIVTLISLITFFILSAVLCGISVKSEWYKMVSFSHELFNGMSDSWINRTFPVISLARNALLVIFVCSTYENSMYLTLSLMIFIQVAFLIYLIVLRPHVWLKDKVSEIFNESVLFLGLIFLYWLNIQSRWSDAVSWVYLSFLMACAVVYFGSAFGKLLIILFI